VSDAMLWQAQQLAGQFGVEAPVVAFQNGGGIRNNSVLPAGDFTELNTFDILPFANFVSVVQGVTPEQLKTLLENAVSRVEFTDGRFAQIAGMRIVYDLNGTPFDLDEVTGQILQTGARILSIVLDDGTVLVQNGQAVAGAPTIALATIDFMGRGGDQYPFPQLGLGFTALGVTYQQSLFNFVTQGLQGVISSADYGDSASARILQTVPEPAAVALFGLGLLGLFARGRRA
jgi:5'-nucleotidase / UDP-sugar diphosphatase